MKRVFLLFAIMMFSLYSFAEGEPKTNLYKSSQDFVSQMNDWRMGDYKRRVTENFLTLDFEGNMNMLSSFENTNPWGAGLRLGFEHKVRPSAISSRYTMGYGVQLGVNRYFGKDIKVGALGSHDLVKRDSYKSYTEIPLLLNFNWYYNFNRSSISLGVAAGVNFMLGERDLALDYVVVEEYFGMSTDNIEFADYVASKQQQEDNTVSLTHVRPTARAVLGYMVELSPDWRLRAQAGVEYQMQYEDKYSGYYIDKGYIEQFHEGTSKANITPFLSIGFAYSL
ncbi:MAG: hypothetical protein Q4Q06_06070 [Bacteroidota bacterium]|nr:hypothetical protein [Bacteroidota bacterium]